MQTLAVDIAGDGNPTPVLVALRTLERNPKYTPALQDKSEVERFCRSEWYKLLTSVDGETLLRMLCEEVA